MNTTPAPGDLRARHVEVLRAIQKFFTFPDDAECKALDAAIAALSALPAGGEPVAWPTEAKRAGDDWQARTALSTHTMGEAQAAVWNACRAACIAAHKRAATTPQPSAAEKCGTCGDTIKPDALTGTTCKCAAVGAQGGGDAEFWAERLDMLAEVHGCGSATMKTCADLIRRLAAPAAGKGVDDAMRQWAQGLIEQLPGDHDGRNSWLLNHGVGDESDWLRAEHVRYSQAWQDWREGSHPERKPNPFREAALTRQPVAGENDNG